MLWHRPIPHRSHTPASPPRRRRVTSAGASRFIRGPYSIAAASTGTNCKTGRAARYFIRRCIAGGCAGDSRFAPRNGESRRLIPLAHVDEMPGDGGGGGHRWRNQVGAALVALPAFEIAVRGRGATLAGRELVGIHGKAHR